MTNIKEKLYGLAIIVFIVYGFWYMENQAYTLLRPFHKCIPTKTNVPHLPILEKFQYDNFRNNYPKFFNEYTCQQVMYTRSQVNLINKRHK
jgi:hypothetical protein